MKASECFCRTISITSHERQPLRPRPARGTGGHRRPRHLRRCRPRTCTSRRPPCPSGSGRWSPRWARWWYAGRSRARRPRLARCCSGWRARPGCSRPKRPTRCRKVIGCRRTCRSPSTPIRWRPGSAARWPRWPGGRTWRCACTWRTRPTRPTCLRGGDVLAAVTSEVVRGAGVHVGDPRLAALRAGRRAGSGRPLPPRPECRLGADAGGGVQREGPAAGRHPRHARRRGPTRGAPGADLGRLPGGGLPRPRLGRHPRAAARAGGRRRPAGAADAARPPRRTAALAALADRVTGLGPADRCRTPQRPGPACARQPRTP